MGGLKFPGAGPKKRRPAKPAPSLYQGFAHPKPGLKRPPMESGQHRRTYVKAKRAGQRRGPWRSTRYKAEVRTLRCCGPDLPHECGGGKIQASHTGEDKGGSMKASDLSCTPKCPVLHEQWEGRKGVFEGWSRQRRQAWAAGKVRETMAALGYVDAEDAYRRAA